MRGSVQAAKVSRSVCVTVLANKKVAKKTKVRLISALS